MIHLNVLEVLTAVLKPAVDIGEEAVIRQRTE